MLRARSAKMKRAPAPPVSRRPSSLPPGHCFGGSDGGPVVMTTQPLGDECAINELLEGRMDLDVHLPGDKIVRMTVERRTPMMDLLIQVTTANKINPGGHVIQLLTDRGRDSVHYKPSTPIGSLDTNTIYIVPKNLNTDTLVKKLPKMANQPFEQTFRLQVNLPRNQLMVMRVSPRTTLAEVKNIVCSEKNLDSSRYHLVHPSKPDVVLDLNSNLAEYGFNEISLLSNKSVSANIRNYQTDLIAYSVREDGARRRGLMSFFSRKKSKGSTGDSSSDGIDSRGESPCRSDNSTGNQVSAPVPGKAAPKKRPAPPPPSKPVALQIEVSTNETTNCALDGGTIYHSRHSSDSSGYHEASVLSESPDSISPDGSSGSGSSGLASMDAPVHPAGPAKPDSTATPAAAPATAKKEQPPPAPAAKDNAKPKRLVSQISTTSHVSTMSRKKKAPPPPPPLATAAAGPSNGSSAATVPTDNVSASASGDVSAQTASSPPPLSSSSVSSTEPSHESVPPDGGAVTTALSSAPPQDTNSDLPVSESGDSNSHAPLDTTTVTMSTSSKSHVTVSKDNEIPPAEVTDPLPAPLPPNNMPDDGLKGPDEAPDSAVDDSSPSPASHPVDVCSSLVSEEPCSAVQDEANLVVDSSEAALPSDDIAGQCKPNAATIDDDVPAATTVERGVMDETGPDHLNPNNHLNMGNLVLPPPPAFADSPTNLSPPLSPLEEVDVTGHLATTTTTPPPLPPLVVQSVGNSLTTNLFPSPPLREKGVTESESDTRRTSSASGNSEELERDFQQTISEAEQAIIKEELEKSTPQVKKNQGTSKGTPEEERPRKTNKMNGDPAGTDLTQQEILSHIEAAFSVVEADDSPIDVAGESAWEYPVPEPPSPFRGNGESLPEFPAVPEEKGKESVGDGGSPLPNHTLQSGDSAPSENYRTQQAESRRRHADDDLVVSSDVTLKDRDQAKSKGSETARVVQRSHSTLPRRPLMNFSIGTYKSPSRSEDEGLLYDSQGAPGQDAMDGGVEKPLANSESSSATNSLTRPSKKGGYGGPGVRIGSFQERNKVLDTDNKIYYDSEGTVRGIKGKVQTLRAEMKSLPMLTGRSASMMNLTDSRKMTSVEGLDSPSTENSSSGKLRTAELKKTSSEVRLNGVSDGMMENAKLDDQSVQEEYSKLQDQFLVWQKQLEYNQALLRNQKIEIPRPTLSRAQAVDEKDSPKEPDTTSQPVPTVQKAQTLPRPKPRPLSVIEGSEQSRTLTLGRPQRPKSQVLANVTITSWHQRSKNHNSLSDILAKFESIENFSSQPEDESSGQDSVRKPEKVLQSPTPVAATPLTNGQAAKLQPKISVKISGSASHPNSSAKSPELQSPPIVAESKPTVRLQQAPQQTVINEIKELNNNATITSNRQTAEEKPTVSSGILRKKPSPPPPLKNVNSNAMTVTISQRPQSPSVSWRTRAPVVRGFSLKQPETDSTVDKTDSSNSISNGGPVPPASKVSDAAASPQGGARPAIIGVKPHVPPKDGLLQKNVIPNGVPKVVRTTNGSVHGPLSPSAAVDSAKKSSVPAPPPPPPPPQPLLKQSDVPKSPSVKEVDQQPKKSPASKEPPKSSKPPPPKLDPREELMLEIRNFTASGSLRKVSDNQKWQLKVFGSSVTSP